MKNKVYAELSKKPYRIFNISTELKPYLEDVLIRNDIFFIYRGPNKIRVEASGTQFHKMVIRAKCEKLNYDNHLDVEETYYVSKIEKIWKLYDLGYLTFIEYPQEK